MSEEYAKGFKDGFAAGLEEGKKMNNKTYTDGFIEGMKTTMPAPYVPPGTVWGQSDVCPKCGVKISGAMGYVCYSPNCPTYPQVTCGPSVSTSMGAMGSAIKDAVGYNGGENGPAGSMSDKEYDGRGWRTK